MKDEIKEIKLEKRKPTFDYILNDLAFDSLMFRVVNGIGSSQDKFDFDYQIKLMQKEVEDLREDNYAYHQLMKMQNKREYRSKFLKEFQEEFGTNVFPDYDEIYKRYDKLKKENERLKKELNALRISEEEWLNETLGGDEEC